MGIVRAFGINAHYWRPKIARIYSEITGLPVGRVVEHADGRQDAVAKAEPAHMTAAELEQFVPLNVFRESLYEVQRRKGFGHDEVVARLFPDGRVKA